ncbi:unnamed protein product [Phytophthora lilii]|uniref:Unnamed protein product n=1 Tax=Phytophthora lilii TaxID=2077276 RepID=A0A9W6XKV9_9STRA|nr:unnamed protein product [Phytophthora lilii]
MTKVEFRDWIAKNYEDKLAQLKKEEEKLEDEARVNAGRVKSLEDCIEQAANKTQRALPPRCLFCVPQPRALLADEALTHDVLYTHFLTPVGDDERRLGEYETLNGKQVAVVGSHIHTGKGFLDRRQVRILLSEKREIQHQEVTVLHISRPLEGGIEVPEDPSEIDVATFRKYTAILRSFPENELVFYQLDETINQVHKICTQEQVYERYKQTLPANLREEWEAAVEELIHAGSFDDVEEDYRLQRRHGGGVSHLLQIQQVVECYLMESLHDLIFPKVVASCQDQDMKLQQVMYRMRHYTPEDFGLHQLLFVMVQAFNQVMVRPDGFFPIAAVIKYISDYHFINSNTTALGFTIANFQVAIEYFLMRGDHDNDCKDCADLALQGGTNEIRCSQMIEESKCVQAAHKIRRDLMKSLENVELSRRGPEAEIGQDTPHPMVAEPNGSASGENASMTQLSIIGEWSTSTEELCGVEDVSVDTTAASSLTVHAVDFIVDGNRAPTNDRAVIQVSGGQRFFAAVTEDGKLLTWGDSSGGRLGYAIADGDSRRVNSPRRVFALQQQTIIQVACGAFHTLVTDLNGHVFSWGSNSKGQLGYLSAGATAKPVESPVVVSDLRGTYINSIACGEYHSIALSSDGRVFSWGCNKFGKLGRVTEGFQDMAVSVVCSLSHILHGSDDNSALMSNAATTRTSYELDRVGNGYEIQNT